MSETRIHPSAVVHEKAQLGTGCEIGPFCVIGEHVRLGDACKLHSHVVIDGHTELGSGNDIYPFAALGLKTQDLKWKGGTTYTRIGDNNTFRENVTVHSATNDSD
ncbi:MAG: UDP-N-acetylglucosamine acyltransferase, partial [Limisphaerales bacterium]